jgi:hypothetical protein
MPVFGAGVVSTSPGDNYGRRGGVSHTHETVTKDYGTEGNGQ